MQIEVIRNLRADKETTQLTGQMMAPCITDLLEFDDDLLDEIEIAVQAKTI